MDVTQLIKDNKARFNFNSQKILLKEKYHAKLVFADQGGLWKCTPEFLSLLSSNIPNNTVICDLYDNPINVNKESLSLRAFEIYHTVMNEWHDEFKTLENNR